MNVIKLRISTEARAIARKLGVNRYLRKTIDTARQVVGKAGYELAFDAALRETIRPGDVVLDVGANVGLYSERFLQAVGTSGQVISIEPVPTCFAALEARCATFPNSKRFNVALGDTDGTLKMALDGDPLGATHSLVNPRVSAQGTGQIDVRVLPGDKLLEEQQLPMPNVIKIDVEGYEEEVLKGLSSTAANPACRAILMEIHFAILDSRGARQAPARISQTLLDCGYKVAWTDSSHLAATR